MAKIRPKQTIHQKIPFHSKQKLAFLLPKINVSDGHLEKLTVPPNNRQPFAIVLNIVISHAAEAAAASRDAIELSMLS